MKEKDYYKQDAVSHSSLSWFEESPLYYRLRQNKEIIEDTFPWMDFGKQIHMYLLESNKFFKSYIHLDFETPKSEQQKQFCEQIAKFKRKNNDRLIKIYSEIYKVSKKSGDKILKEANNLSSKFKNYIQYLKYTIEYKDILSDSKWNMIMEMGKKVQKHTKANELLNLSIDGIETYNEFPIYWKHPETNVSCKSLIDRLVINHNRKEISLVDIKTTNKFKGFKDKASEFKYFRQLAFYWYALFYYFKQQNTDEKYKDYKKSMYIIAIKTIDPVEVKVYNINETLLREFPNEIDHLIEEISWHEEHNLWEHSRSYYKNEGINKLE